MLRITKTVKREHRTTLVVEGLLTGRYAKLLEAECNERLEEGCGLELDLSSVSYADPDGASVVSELLGRGVEIIACSPYVRELMERLKSR
ncbi:hypothetical protein K8I85_08825 [bacterium]|nr:hypothetical protein [bacterium]